MGLRVKCDLGIAGWDDEPNTACAVQNIERGRLEFDLHAANAEKISKLNLSTANGDSGFSSIPREIFVIFPHLKYLIIESNIQTISPDDWINARNLSRLDLDYNELSELKAGTFAGLDELRTLELRYNLLTIISRGIFSGLVNLREVHFYDNKIHTIEDGAFENLPLLIGINLASNKLTTLSDTLFCNLPKLSSLSLGGNDLTHIGQSLYCLEKIHQISLKNNRHKIIDFSLIGIAKLTTLKDLNLKSSKFSFEKQSNEAVENSSLQSLDLANNNLTDPLDLQQLSIFKELSSLDLQDNPYNHFDLGTTNIKEILPKLDYLNLRRTNISCEHLSVLREQLIQKNVEFARNRC